MTTLLRFQLRAIGVPLGLLALVVATTVVTYQGAMDNDFVLDDIHSVTSNRAIRSLGHAWDWFSSPYAVSNTRESANYRPILVASYAVDHALFGEGPKGFHATNLLIHVGVVAMVCLLARRLWEDWGAALAAAAVFALHPINAEAVNYLTARSSSLTALWVAGAILAYDAAFQGTDEARGGLRHRRRWLAAAAVFGLLALGTKETAAILPVLILSWDRARFGDRVSWRERFVRSVPFWGLVAVVLVVRMIVLAGVQRPWSTAATGQSALFSVKIGLASLGHWVWPVGLAVDHAWPMTIGGSEAVFLLTGAVVAGVGTWGACRLDRKLGWCFAWFWVALLPLVALPLVARLTLYQDHRVYLAGFGLAWAAGWLAMSVARMFPRHAVARIGAAVLIGSVIVASIRGDRARTAVWHDAERLWTDVLEKYPQSAMAHSELGVLLGNAGRPREALVRFERARALLPQWAYPYLYLGITYRELGDFDSAIKALETALAIRPRSGEARVNLGKVYERQGRPDLALGEYERALRDDQDLTSALLRSGALFERQGRLDEAIDRYQRVVALDSGDDEARIALGAVLLRAQRWVESREVFHEVLARHPRSSAAHYSVGLTYAGEGRDDLALDQFRQALSLNDEDADVFFQIGLVSARRQQWAEASAWYQRALERDPRHVSSHIALGFAAERLGDVVRAAKHYQVVLATVPDEPGYEKIRASARQAMARLGRPRLRSGEAAGAAPVPAMAERR